MEELVEGQGLEVQAGLDGPEGDQERADLARGDQRDGGVTGQETREENQVAERAGMDREGGQG